jgi:hypothetical protein
MITDLTIGQLLHRQGVTVRKNMTVADFIAGVKKLGPLLATYFPALVPILNALQTINTAYTTATKYYAQAMRVLKTLQKAATDAAGSLTGNPTAPQSVVAEAQKAAVNQVNQAVNSAYAKVKDKVLNTPISALV